MIANEKELVSTQKSYTGLSMDPIKITLKTMPPALNQTYKRGRSSFYKSEDARVDQEAIQWEARAQYRGKPLIGPVRVDFAFYWPSGRRDWDSGLKSLCDALEGICYENDSQITEGHVYKSYSPMGKAQKKYKDALRVEVLVSTV